MVEKGNEVVIIAAKGGFNATTKGVALQTGGEGEQIKVQNSQSKKVIRAVVTGLNQVHTQF
ncbi:flagellar basal body P-ring formation chaperone FlgA [Vibrio variabilis]|uniref:flagellar basal body P-ring formation chaperone FlgA n=1 Tax=Vibrio variabilis TaxID=990271 RepID=UPI0023B87643|nr:flagellar basal body P-ring formation chaperone FlgA [Vibrio variabilis]